MKYDIYGDSAPPQIVEKNIFEEAFKNDPGNFEQNLNIEDVNNLNEQMGNLNINNNKPKKKKLIPRDYQIKIYEEAKNKNSILYVETGKGKTFISIMLMANLLGIDIYNEKKPKIDKTKKIIFFVCDTALVDQQRNEIENALEIEVGTIQGKKEKKSKNDYEAFKKKWNSLNIFVAIPSIVYKILSCGFIKIFDISMIVFDECHHTGEDHPYNKIMNEFYFFYKKKKELEGKCNYPLIYGLTASPIKTGVKGNSIEVTAFDALQRLSENLDCQIVIDPEMINANAKEMRPGETIEQYLNDDTYIEVKYHANMDGYKKVFLTLYNECFFDLMNIGFSDLARNNQDLASGDYKEQYTEYLKLKYNSLNLDDYNKVCQNYDHLYNLQKYSPFFIIFEKIQRHSFMILENLCLDSLISYFNTLVKNYDSLYQRKINEEYNNHEKNSNYLEEEEIHKNNYSRDNSSLSLKSLNSEEDDDETDVSSLASESIYELKEIFLNIYNKLKELEEQEKNYYSDRLLKLYSKITDLFKMNVNSKFIIFIANRVVAHFLKPALSSFLKEHFTNKKCDEIIGINKQKSGGGTTLTPSLTLKKLNEIIYNFNEDKFDILIGTSAIEEGLDIQSCNAVLALVELNTPKSFIQIKGRARKSNSHFYVFTNSAKIAKLKIENFIKIGKKINDLFNGKISQDFRREGYIYRKPTFFFEMDYNSHSKITMGNVTMFFNEIKQQIESNGVKFKTKLEMKQVKSKKGNQEFEYYGIINIETDLKDIMKLFPYTSKIKNTKDNATKDCHFHVLNILKKYKYLDCHLKFFKNKV